MSEIWIPNPKGQHLAFAMSECPDMLLDGDRGGGKSLMLLKMFFAQVGIGFGRAIKGVIIRQTAKGVEELLLEARHMIPRIFPGTKIAEGHIFIFPTGERLYIEHASAMKDYNKFHGKNYTYVGIDELTQYADQDLVTMIKSTLRSATEGVPVVFRAATNPFGPGHNWVKARYIDPAPTRSGALITETIDDPLNPGTPITLYRTRIQCSVRDNHHLLRAQPHYLAKIADGLSPALYEAWINGSWDITSGGMFDDLWDKDVHVLPSFDIPGSWYVDRCLDWGDSTPFSVLWVAESDGTPAIIDGVYKHMPRGSLVIFSEWYGWNGTPNKGTRLTAGAVAVGIKEREKYLSCPKVHKGPADNSLHTPYGGHDLGAEMAAAGVTWKRSDKSPHTRRVRWGIIRQMLGATLPPSPTDITQAEIHRERPHLYVTSNCIQFIRTVPPLPMDPAKPEDIISTGEDHLADAFGYRVLEKRTRTLVERLRI